MSLSQPLPRAVARRGMTLVEMLVATAATLILMAAIAQVFAVFGSTVSSSRGTLALDGRLRNVAWRLRTDLNGATARTLPPLSPDSAEGYFELIEGPQSDFIDVASGNAIASGITAVGPTDTDDVLLFTTRNTETPFIGQAPTTAGAVAGSFESTVAEVAWFARKTPGSQNPETYTLFRKQLLVMGYVGAAPFATDNKINYSDYQSTWNGYYTAPCDISVRREKSPPGTSSSNSFDVLLPNSLSDLTRRENRFLHNALGLTTTGFPFAFVTHQAISAPDGLTFPDGSSRAGEDVILDNVIAFDVRVFDPAAPVFITTNGTPLVPGDPNFSNAPDSCGAYVDLGNGVNTNTLLTGVVLPHFGGNGDARSGLRGTATTRRTYDTWSTHYEANGRNENDDNFAGSDGLDNNHDGATDESGEDIVDEGTDGLDNNANGIIDEVDVDLNGDGDTSDALEQGERETSPPYPYPLRGIEIRIRCFEPSSRQVRQVTVRHTFVPH